MEMILRLPDGRIMSSKKQTDTDQLGELYVQPQIQPGTHAYNTEVRDLIRQSMELDKLSARLDAVGYPEWVASGDKKRFYDLIEILNSEQETARQYWLERNNSAHRLRAARTNVRAKVVKGSSSTDSNFEPS